MKEYIFFKKMMGTEIDISIVTNNKILAKEKSKDIFKVIKQYENIFSRFREDSELSILNKEKKKKVSSIFFEVSLEAKRLFKLSDGKFNPLVQVKNFGYNKTFSKIDQNFKFKKKEINLNFNEIKFNKKNREIILKEKQELDFGGFLKGYLAEKLTNDFLKKKEILGSIINFGGDIYTIGLDENDREFLFSIYNPIAKNDILAINIKNMSISTSGTYKRRWKFEDKEVSHILNNKGGFTEGKIISATVISKNASESDALATAIMSMKISEAQDFLEKRNRKYILIIKDGKIIKN